MLVYPLSLDILQTRCVDLNHPYLSHPYTHDAPLPTTYYAPSEDGETGI